MFRSISIKKIATSCRGMDIRARRNLSSKAISHRDCRDGNDDLSTDSVTVIRSLPT